MLASDQSDTDASGLGEPPTLAPAPTRGWVTGRRLPGGGMERVDLPTPAGPTEPEGFGPRFDDLEDRCGAGFVDLARPRDG
jgi:hypothetical protein